MDVTNVWPDNREIEAVIYKYQIFSFKTCISLIYKNYIKKKKLLTSIYCLGQEI